MLRAVMFFIAGIVFIFLILSIIAQQHFSMQFPRFTNPNAPMQMERLAPNMTDSAGEQLDRYDMLVASGEVIEEAVDEHEKQRKATESAIDKSTEEDLSLHEIIELNIALLANIESSAAFQHHRLLTFAIHDFGDTTIHALVCSGSRCSGLFRNNSEEQAQALGEWLIHEQVALGFIKEGKHRVFVEDNMHFVHVVLTTDPSIALPHNE